MTESLSTKWCRRIMQMQESLARSKKGDGEVGGIPAIKIRCQMFMVVQFAKGHEHLL